MENLSLDQLSEEVTRHLEARGLLGSSTDHRVSASPDARTIRYYTTLGLLDRPRVQGRQAQYGERHLLQLLAIKALQAQGLALGEIQSRLYGCTNGELQAVVASARAASLEGTGAGTSPPVLTWREINIEPGLKLLVEEGWSSSLDEETRQERIRAALAAIQSLPGKGDRRTNA